ncbi:MAG: glycosyltransferase [Candidatus Riflebacteria bacterium]|nr:glycosyltransferase [Candidatus Riflebacteria bacterium]
MHEILYSIIVPAFNEAEVIAGTLGNIQASMQQINTHGELILVDNNSTDDTARIAESCGAIIVHEPIRQIARARNAGAAKARGRYLIFIDADTRVTTQLLNESLQLLTSDRIAGGGARVEFDVEQPFFARAILRFWQTISRAARLAAGCFVFCTAEAFKQAGGFDEKVFASEEIGFSFRVRAWATTHHQRFVIIDKPGITTSSRKNKSPLQILATMLLFSLFPVATRFRSMCFLWYSCRHQS